MRGTLLIWIIVMASFSVYAQKDKKAAQILDEVGEKTRSYKNISAEFIFTMENKEMEINEKNEGSIIVNGKKYVIDLPAIGMKVYSDGETIWNYMKDGNQVTISNIEDQQSELMDPSSVFTIYDRGFKPKFSGEKNRGDTTVYQVELYPEKEEYEVSKVILNIDKSSMMISSALFYGTDGNLYGIEVKKLETNLDIPDSFFVFNKSDFSDIEIIDFR